MAINMTAAIKNKRDSDGSNSNAVYLGTAGNAATNFVVASAYQGLG